MKKTLIAATLAAASIGAAHAQSNVRLYGLTDMWVGQVKNSALGTQMVANSGGMTTSYWGMGGTEDLGGGLKAVFALEGFIRTDEGNSGRFNGDPMFARSAYIGDRWRDVQPALATGGIGMLVPGIETPANDVDTARSSASPRVFLEATLLDAVTRALTLMSADTEPPVTPSAAAQ